MHIYARRVANIPDFTRFKSDLIMLEGEDWFYYFAYGSNLCAERLKLKNPSAVKVAVARLDDYRLDFNYFSRRWNGAAATIVEDSGNKVWGIVWKLKNSDLANLDRQEGVGNKVYRRFRVTVNTPDGLSFRCWTYQLVRPLEEDRRPSAVYKSVIIRGAMDNELPEEYIAQLRRIADNGYDGPCEVQLEFLPK